MVFSSSRLYVGYLVSGKFDALDLQVEGKLYLLYIYRPYKELQPSHEVEKILKIITAGIFLNLLHIQTLVELPKKFY